MKGGALTVLCGVAAAVVLGKCRIVVLHKNGIAEKSKIKHSNKVEKNMIFLPKRVYTDKILC